MVATSDCFAVDLPALSPDQLGKISTWGKASCVKSDVVMKQDGSYMLIAQKADVKDLRSRQRLLSTNLKNWNFDLSGQTKGWLRLLTQAEYEAIASSSNNVSTQAMQEDSVVASAPGTEPPGTL